MSLRNKLLPGHGPGTSRKNCRLESRESTMPKTWLALRTATSITSKFIGTLILMAEASTTTRLRATNTNGVETDDPAASKSPGANRRWRWPFRAIYAANRRWLYSTLAAAHGTATNTQETNP